MNIMEALQKIQSCLQFGENIVPKSLPPLPIVVEEARQEWLDAQCYYNTVSDEDLIDHAVYLMQAAEKKYMYLLKQARYAGVVHSPYCKADHKDMGDNEMLNP